MRGAKVDWRAYDAPFPRRVLALPGYPFERERLWVEEAAGHRLASSAARAVLHPLLGSEIPQSLTDDRLFEADLSLEMLPYLADHRIRGALLLPSPALMEMARAAAELEFGSATAGLEDFTVHQPLRVDERETMRLQLVLEPRRQGAAAFRIASYDQAARVWRRHATGRLVAGDGAPRVVDLEAIRRRTTNSIPVESYYEWLASLGLEFGARFRHAESIFCRDGEVLARVRVCEEFAAGRSYRLHPAVLDSCLHLIGAALPGATRELRDPFLLLNVERITSHLPLPADFWVHVELPRAVTGDLDALESFVVDLRLVNDDGAVIAGLQGVHLKRVPVGKLPQAASRIQNLLYEIAWPVSLAERPPMPSPRRVAADVQPRLTALAEQNRLDSYAEFQAGLDALAVAYVMEALGTLGFGLTPGEVFDEASLAETLSIPERHKRLFQRMLAMLGEDGLLVRDGPRWRVAEPVPAPDSQSLGESLAHSYPDGMAELTLTRRCGEQLAAVIRGQADPLALMFPGGSLADAEALYRDSLPARTYNTLLSEIVARAGKAASAEQPLRILEIGAGTGSTTSRVLEQLVGLPEESLRYCFTDVSPLFLNRAAEKFGDRRGMRFQMLDIARDPGAQDLQPASFDVIIAANVLHATPDLDATLAHVRSLLRPGGWLLLLEGTSPQRFGDLTVGLLDGWWAYTDLHRRSYALMDRPAWLELLAAQGFDEAVAIPGEDSGPVLSQQAILLARAPLGGMPESGRWLIVPDRAGLAERVTRRLAALGQHAELLTSVAPPALESALREPCSGIVHLAALDATLDERVTPDALLGGQEQLLGGTLNLVQGLAARSGPPVRLWIVTRGGQAIARGESADPAQATAWGLGHVIALEHPELECRRLDLDPSETLDACADALIAELGAPDREDQLAARAGRRLVRRLVRSRTPAEGHPPVRGDRSYLVTGGLSGLGLKVGEWLVDQGARGVVLAGRRPPDERAKATIHRLRERGAELLVCRCDVGQRADVERMLAEISERMPPLAGIVHSAGVLDDGGLLAQSWKRFATVMHPKVTGSWHLHQLAPDLDFLVLFSSGASLAGSPGQANHAAANSFEDALAWYRQARGLPTLSVNWGPWSQIGAAVDRSVNLEGFTPIQPEDGLAALGALMAVGAAGQPFRCAQAAVFETDWSQLADASSASRVAPLFEQLAAEGGRRRPADPAPAERGGEESGLMGRLLVAPPNRRKKLLREFVRLQTAKVLGARRPEDLDFDEPLRQLGLDSLMAVELRNQLGSATQRTLSATITFDHPSISALVDYLAGELFADEPDQPASAPAGESATASGLDTLTEEELAERLSRRISKLGSLE